MASEEAKIHEELKITPHEELCDQALEHYNEISTTAMHSNSLVPAAINFYKERWVPQGERKIVYTPGTLATALEEGWVFDPWLNPRGRPTPVGGPITVSPVIPSEIDNAYWVLVKGTPEQIEALKPLVELPSDEPVPEPESKPYGLETMFIAHGEKDSSGEPKKPPQGFVVMHKDHIFAKGTVYTKIPEKASQ